MALLRLSNGRVYTAPEDINRSVAPMQVGEFTIPPDARARVRDFKHPLSQDDALFVLKSLDPQVSGRAEQAGFKFRRVGTVVPSPADDGTFVYMQRFADQEHESAPVALSAQAVRDYLVPHHVLVNDWHCVFSGAIIKGVQLRDGLQGVVYCEAGNWIRLGPQVLNWPVFPHGRATVAVSMFDQPCTENFKMDLHPEVQIKPDMLY
jgi:hypothetical protein